MAEPEKSGPPSLGSAAANALAPVNIFIKLLFTGCFVFGIGFVLAGIIRYKEYRENPSQTPLSRPILMLIFGLIMLAIPIIAKFSESSAAVLL